MKLEQIGFYTLSDKRASTASHLSPLSRCELLLTSRCNFRCPYCRNIGGDDLPFEQAVSIVEEWARQDLFAIRFSGGEPLLYPRLRDLVSLAKLSGIQRIAVSSNGSQPLSQYEDLLAAGVNDLSISLDACCAEDNLKMTGGAKGAWEIVTSNIKALSRRTYLTVGVVLTPQNSSRLNEIVSLADGLGVSDIRIIPAAQCGDMIEKRLIGIEKSLVDKYPILRYRLSRIMEGLPVRGLRSFDSNRCRLVLDDMAICGNLHYPCIIYLREGGGPIGPMGPDARLQRKAWSETHDTHADPICRRNCLDVCVHYNNRSSDIHEARDLLISLDAAE